MAQNSLEPRVNFEWRLDPDSDEKTARQFADEVRRTGGTAHLQEPPKGLLPLAIPFVIMGAAKLAALIEQISGWWSKRKADGLLIHVTKDGTLDIRPLNIPYGQIVFVGKDGQTFKYVNVSKNTLGDLLASARGGVPPPGGTALGG